MSYQEFRQSYITALFWSTTDCRGNGDCSCNDCECFDSWADESDFADGELAKIDTMCRSFYDTHSDDFVGASTQCTQDEQAGHDFCMTQNGHGCGFWDGDWPEPAATRLTSASESARECNIYTGDDGEIYVS